MQQLYQLVFTGQLLKGRDPVQVAQGLAQRLRLPQQEVASWLGQPCRKVLATSLSMEQAKQLRMQLASLGAVTVVEAQTPSHDTVTQHRTEPASSSMLPPRHGWPWLRRFSPLHSRWLFAPAMLLAAAVSLLVVLVHLGLILSLTFAVLLPSASTSWAGNMLGNPLLGMLVQLVVFTISLLGLLLLLKPLLSIRWPRYRGVLLNARREPDLHAFIDDICERIHVPPPAVIYLEYQPQLAVHYHYGPIGWFRQRSVMRLGMPLVAGMDCSQLAGVLAGCLNRFQGRYLPRANSLVLALQSWLQTALHQPDLIDQKLDQWHRDGRMGEGFYRQFTRFVAVAHGPLWLWLWLSQLFACKPIHRIMADADRLALSLSGSEGFLRQTEQSLLLQYSNEEWMPGLEQQWIEQQILPADLIQDMVLRSRQYPSSTVQKLRTQQTETRRIRAMLLPDDLQRLEWLNAGGLSPGYHCRSPAISLFSNYARLSAAMTLRYYHHRLHLPVSRYHLRQMIAERSLEGELERLYQAQFAGLYLDYPPLGLKPMVSAWLQKGVNAELWQEADRHCRAGEGAAQAIMQAWQDSKGLMINAQTREEIHLAGLWRAWGEGRLSRTELESVHQWAREAEVKHEKSLKSQHKALQPYAQRMAAALVHASLHQPEAEQEVLTLLDILSRIERVAEALRELSTQALLLEVLLSFGSVTPSSRLQSRIEQRSSDIERLLTSIGLSLKHAKYPFHDSRYRHLMAYLLEEALEGKKPLATLERAQDMLTRLPRVQGRVMLRLAELAKRGER